MKVLKKIERLGSKWWGMLFLLALPFVIALSPVLIFGKLFANGDTLNWAYPLYFFYKNSILNGSSFILNPHILGGIPSYITAVPGFFSPLHYFVFRFFSVFSGYSFLIFFYATMGSFCISRILKYYSVDFWGQYLAGAVYIFSYWHMISDLSVMTSLFFLALLILLTLWIAGDRHIPVFIGAFSIGLMWLTTHYNWTIIVLSIVSFFAIWLACTKKEFTTVKKKLYFLMKFFLAGLIGSCIGLIQLLPMLQYLPVSSRAAGLSYAQATVESLSIFDFFRYIFPYFKVPLIPGSSETLFIGLLSITFVVVATRGIKNKPASVRFFVFLLFFCILMSIQYSPLFWILQKTPLLEYFRAPSRWMIGSSLAVAILSGIGLQSIVQKKNAWLNRYLVVWKWFIVTISSISIMVTGAVFLLGDRIVFYLQSYFEKNMYSTTTGLPIEHYFAIIKDLFVSLSNNVNIFRFGFTGALVFLILSYFILKKFHSGKMHPSTFSSLTVGVVVLSFVSMLLPYHVTVARTVVQQPSRVASFLRDNPGTFFTFMPGFSEYTQLSTPFNPTTEEIFTFQSEMVVPNLSELYNLRTIDGYDNLMPERLSYLLALTGSDRAPVGDKLTEQPVSLEEKIALFASRKTALDFLGVDYVISSINLGAVEGLEKVFVTNIEPYNTPVEVYYNAKGKPDIYFAQSLEVFDDNDISTDKLLDALWQNKTPVSCGENCSNIVTTEISDGETITMIEDKPHYIKFKTQTDVSRLVVVSRAIIPGWEATVNNKKTDIVTVGTVYMGIIVSPGISEIELRYSYPHFFNN